MHVIYFTDHNQIRTALADVSNWCNNNHYFLANKYVKYFCKKNTPIYSPYGLDIDLVPEPFKISLTPGIFIDKLFRFSRSLTCVAQTLKMYLSI